MIPVTDGTLLEDWLDACSVATISNALNPSKWIDELRFRTNYDSTANMA